MPGLLALLLLLLSSLLSVRGGESYAAINCRKHTASLVDFGGVGDGKTSNTEAFRRAVANLSVHAADGGVQLVVPEGKWLTGSFNLTSHFTLYLEKDATILASQVHGCACVVTLTKHKKTKSFALHGLSVESRRRPQGLTSDSSREGPRICKVRLTK